MAYEPKIKTTERSGKIALWIPLPDGYRTEDWNIWDLERHEYTENVQNAIRVAFELGRDAQKKLMNR